MLLAMIAVASLTAFDCSVPGARAVAEFDVLQPPDTQIKLPRGLTLSFQYPDESGFDTVVTYGTSKTNLVHYAPHGPDWSDIYAWQHFQRYMADVRHLRVRGHHAEVIVDLRDAKSAGDPEKDARDAAHGVVLAGPSANFVGGTIRVCWRSLAPKR